MNKLITAVACAAIFASAAVHAQATDPKTEWATKVVALQQGPELDRLVSQLTASTTQDLIANWGPRLDALPKAKLPKATEDMNAELKKYADDAVVIIGKQVTKVSNDALVPAYSERFTLDELKDLVAFFQSPAVKKYQANAPELGNLFVQKLIEASRSDVLARVKQFDDAAVKIVGTAPAATAPAAPAATAKPPAKK